MASKAFTPCEDCLYDHGQKVRATTVATFWTWNNDGDTRPVCDACAQANATYWKVFTGGRVGNPERHDFRALGGPYDGECGSKGGGASWDAADQMKTRAGRLRVQCIEMIRQYGPLGADRLAFLMDEDEDNISPRLSELVTQYEVLTKGPKTATTKRGNPAHVYQLAEAS